jgi:hypothetical protein
MSAISSLAHAQAASAPTLLSSGSSATSGRASDGDTAAQEAAEGASTKIAEVQNGGRAPSKNIVNKTA